MASEVQKLKRTNQQLQQRLEDYKSTIAEQSVKLTKARKLFAYQRQQIEKLVAESKQSELFQGGV